MNENFKSLLSRVKGANSAASLSQIEQDVKDFHASGQIDSNVKDLLFSHMNNRALTNNLPFKAGSDDSDNSSSSESSSSDEASEDSDDSY